MLALYTTVYVLLLPSWWICWFSRQLSRHLVGLWVTGHPTAMGLLRRILVSIHSWIDGKIISCNKTIRPKIKEFFSFLLSVSVTAIILNEFDNITKKRGAFLVDYIKDWFFKLTKNPWNLHSNSQNTSDCCLFVLQPSGLLTYLDSDADVPTHEDDKLHVRDNVKLAQVNALYIQ